MPFNSSLDSEIIPSTIIPQVCDDPTYSLDRFLGHNGQLPIDQQRPPPSLRESQDGVGIEEKVKGRILTQLQEFDRKFGCTSSVSSA
ncbi:hypothetical protein V8C35DRAFT_309273 [Trichoderma chlorosporum]